MSRHINQEDINAIRDIIIGMHDDHIKYPQLRLPEMQAGRLDRMWDILTKPVSKENCEHIWEYTMDHVYWCSKCKNYGDKNGKVIK